MRKSTYSIGEIDKIIAQYKTEIDYLERVKKIKLAKLDKRSNIDYIVYKKYIELCNVNEVAKWLRENGYKYLGYLSFQANHVTEVIEKRNPDVDEELKYICKSIFHDNRNWEKLPMYKIWWEKWNTQNIDYKKRKTYEELKNIIKRTDIELKDKAIQYETRLIQLETSGDKIKFKQYIEEVFEGFLKPILEKA